MTAVHEGVGRAVGPARPLLMSVYELVRSSLPEFLGGLGTAAVVALFNRGNRWRRDRRSRSEQDRPSH